MYVNFEKLAESGMSPSELLWLIAIKQKDDLIIESIPEDGISKFDERGFIKRLKNGSVRISNKGASYLEVIETSGITDEISRVLERLIELYASYGKDIGVSRKEAQNRLIWFMSNTNFRGDVIVGTVERYLEENPDYTLSLCNLIWKPASQAFSVHMTLNTSKLFDMISEKYGFNTTPFFSENKNKVMEWLFAVSRLPSPPVNPDPAILFTMNSKKDKERITEIKKYLLNMIKKNWK